MINFVKSQKIFLTLAAVAIVYSLLAFVIFPAESFFAGDEGVRFIQTESLLKQHYRSLSLSYPGKDLDPQNKFFPITSPYAIEREGRMYSQWPVFFPFLSSFCFAAFGMRGLYLIPVLSSLLTLLLVSAIFRLLFQKDSVLAVLLLAFATPVFFYSLVFWEHTLSIFFSTLALYLILVGVNRPGYRWMFLAGASLGLGIWARNEVYFFVLALLLSGLAVRQIWRENAFQKFASFFIGILLVLVPMWAIQKATVGEFLGADVSQFSKGAISTEASPFKESVFSFLLYKLKLAAVLLFHRFDSEWMVVLAVPFLFLALSLISSRFKKGKTVLVFSLVGVSSVSLFGLSQNLLNSGLLFNAPILIFSLALLPRHGQWKTHSKQILFVPLTGLIYILLLLLFAPATGGMQWGPRFLLPALPPLVVAIGALWDNWELLDLKRTASRLARATFVLLALVSMYIQIAGIQYLYRNRKEDARLVSKVRARPEKVLVSDNFWFPQETAILYESKKFYFANSLFAVKELAQRAAAQGERTFAFVSLNPSRDSSSFDVGGFRFLRTERVELSSQFWLESYTILRRRVPRL